MMCRPLVLIGRFPTPGQGAAARFQNAGNRHPSTISPAYSRGHPAADSRVRCHNSHTAILPTCGSPPVRCGKAHEGVPGFCSFCFGNFGSTWPEVMSSFFGIFCLRHRPKQAIPRQMVQPRQGEPGGGVATGSR